MIVLVVEDEAIIAHSSAAEIEEAGHAVLGPAHSSSEALALAQDHAPGVALVDIDLEAPGAGIQLARQLSAYLDIVVVFTTAQAEVARANADCAIGVLAKPYDPSELADVVEYAETIGHGERRAAPAHVRSFERFPAPSIPRSAVRRGNRPEANRRAGTKAPHAPSSSRAAGTAGETKRAASATERGSVIPSR